MASALIAGFVAPASANADPGRAASPAGSRDFFIWWVAETRRLSGSLTRDRFDLMPDAAQEEPKSNAEMRHEPDGYGEQIRAGHPVVTKSCAISRPVANTDTYAADSVFLANR